MKVYIYIDADGNPKIQKPNEQNNPNGIWYKIPVDENVDVTRKYEFENSNISMIHTVGNCWNRNDLFYLDITIYYWIDGMDIYMKEYLKDNPSKKIIKNSNF